MSKRRNENRYTVAGMIIQRVKALDLMQPTLIQILDATHEHLAFIPSHKTSQYTSYYGGHPPQNSINKVHFRE